MAELAPQTQIDIAAAYEELFVPALFQAWPTAVLDAAGVAAGQRVLDVACGTGVLARAAAERVGPSGHVAGLDLNPGMLAMAERLAPEIEWRHGDAEALPFENGSCDAVVSQFGMMFFPNKEKAIREMMRVLRPGGRFAVAVWDAFRNVPVFQHEYDVVLKVSGKRAAEAILAPFSLGDRQELAGLFSRAGVRSFDLQTVRRPARFPSVESIVDADIKGWLPLEGIILTHDENRRILEELERLLRPHLTAEGTVQFEVSAHVISGQKPGAVAS